MYKKIPKEDEAYKKASEQIDFIKKDIVRKTNSLVEAGNQSLATSMLTDYVSIVSDDKTALDLLKKISGKNETQIREVIVKNEVSAPSTSYNPNSLVGTYHTITSGEANTRSGPSKSSPVIGTIKRGTRVYVDEIYVESAYRTLCRTNYGWVSYNTMNGSIK